MVLFWRGWSVVVVGIMSLRAKAMSVASTSFSVMDLCTTWCVFYCPDVVIFVITLPLPSSLI